MQTPFALKEFIALPPEDGLDAKISERTTQLSATRQAAKLVARKQLDQLRSPPSPRSLAQVLGKHSEVLSKQVEDRIRRHIGERLDGSGEAWLRQGLTYASNAECPFCGQSLTHSDLIQCYREFFSEAYREHVIEIRQSLNALRQRYSDDELSTLERVVSENSARIRAWEDLADLSNASISLDKLRSSWRAMRAQLENTLQRKLEDPGSAATEPDQTEATIRDFEQAIAEFEAFNTVIAAANAAIAELKRQSASANPEQIEAELRLLRNKQIRQGPDVSGLCNQLLQLQIEKRAQETEKEDVRKQLEKQAQALLVDHEGEINRLLAGFGANFRVTGTKPVFPGGNASSTYQLQINGVDLALGDARTPRGTPCFRTALSAGDKSTLALAFFLAKLRRDPTLSGKVVVFDDPLSSLDSFRISFTQHELARIAEQAEQTVILSHDPFFLQGISAADCSPTAKPLRIARKGGTHTLHAWEIDKECMPQAHKDYFVLCRFMDDGRPDGGDLVTVARSIRPYVEGYLRLKFPDRFASGKMLGAFIKMVREAPTGDELKMIEPRIAELEDINGFARRFPHDNPGQTTDAEVETYVRKAFGFVRG
jgi:wobble nucleotide-excising tRNase